MVNGKDFNMKLKKHLLYVCLTPLLLSCASNSLVSPIDKSVPKDFRNEVLVLGTPHLSGKKKLTPKHLNRLVSKLSSWQPTQICVETRSPSEIYQMTQIAPFNIGVRKTLKMFDQYKVDISKQENKRFKYSFFKAQALLQKELKSLNKNYEKVIQLSLISYDYFNALLYWTRLNDKEKRELKITKKSKDHLNKSLLSKGEINSLAIRLANKNRLSKLCAIDSQISTYGVLEASEKEIDRLFASPKRAQFREKAAFKEYIKIQETSLESGDLLPLYAHLNSSEVNYEDEKQWEWLYEDSTETGLNRVRFSAWDSRNVRIANNIIGVSQSRKKERILVIIGSSHKSIIDRFLKASNSISVESMKFD